MNEFLPPILSSPFQIDGQPLHLSVDYFQNISTLFHQPKREGYLIWNQDHHVVFQGTQLKETVTKPHSPGFSKLEKTE